MKIIASENSRSLAKEMEFMCKQRIKAYEDENGEISVEEKPTRKQAIDEQKETIKNRNKLGALRTYKESFQNGFNLGNADK